MTDTPFTPKQNREKMTQIMFETLDVPALYIAIPAVLSLYASGKITGLAIDSGHQLTSVVPVYEGHALRNDMEQMCLAGSDVTKYIIRLLSERGIYLAGDSNLECVRDIKEKYCYVAYDYCEEMNKAEYSVDLEKMYKMPDGREISVGKERFTASEAIFHPLLVGLEQDGVDVTAYKSVMKFDSDIRRQLFGNVVISGGSTMFPGFSGRIVKGLKKRASPSMNVSLVCPHIDRKLSAWLGGKILCSLASFQQSWILKDEYEESGPAIVHRKCF